MPRIINSIEEMEGTAKINASTPFNRVLTPFLDDARDKYLIPYLGLKFVEKLETNLDENKDSDKPYIAIRQRVRRVLSPFALYLGSAELSINYGDSGHTVSRTDSRAPASDAKIEKSDSSLEARAWQNLEYLILELEEKIDKFPEWKESAYYKNKSTHFFKSASDFQDKGLINIEYSRLTFEKLRQLIIRIEKTIVQDLLTENIYDSLQKEIDDDKPKEKTRKKLLDAVYAFIGSKVAELHTSQTTRIQRSQNNRLEYKAVIRPLYEDIDDTGNYYAEQAIFWEGKIIGLLQDFGLNHSGTGIKFNEKTKKIFYSQG